MYGFLTKDLNCFAHGGPEATELHEDPSDDVLQVIAFSGIVRLHQLYQLHHKTLVQSSFGCKSGVQILGLQNLQQEVIDQLQVRPGRLQIRFIIITIEQIHRTTIFVDQSPKGIETNDFDRCSQQCHGTRPRATRKRRVRTAAHAQRAGQTLGIFTTGRGLLALLVLDRCLLFVFFFLAHRPVGQNFREGQALSLFFWHHVVLLEIINFLAQFQLLYQQFHKGIGICCHIFQAAKFCKSCVPGNGPEQIVLLLPVLSSLSTFAFGLRAARFLRLGLGFTLRLLRRLLWTESFRAQLRGSRRGLGQ
mmetsp:Transcript_23081/g.27243  ORF Transcript_23081/g.27243 Transcript_23081/m.27243 type:complete len:305 (+) Transcript_23081:257-1171(+)